MKPLTLVTFILVLLASPWLARRCYPALAIPHGNGGGPLRFDAILELNAPIVGTHVVLFVRCWVSADYYCASVVWAEPHIAQLNFCTYPITLNVQSDEAAFSPSSQIVDGVNSRFSKPVGDRGVFRCMFNEYPVSNLRYADSEEYAARLFVRDLESLNGRGVERPLTLPVLHVAGKLETGQCVGSIRVDATEGQVSRIDLCDVNDRVVKTIQYEYSATSNEPALKRQIVVLPERSIKAGLPVESVKVRSNGNEVDLGTFPRLHHAGSRICSVEYRPISVGDANLVLPQRVSVRDGRSQELLRAIRFFAFERCEVGKDSAAEAARLFSHFSPEMLKCRELLLAYWLKDPTEVALTDRRTLRELQAHFDGLDRHSATAGVDLRRINMLFQLDWMLGDSGRLVAHYDQYLRLLNACELDEMVLLGGYHVIETTVRWGQLVLQRYKRFQ